MESDSPQVKAYLEQLNRMAKGDVDAKVSMHDVGKALGLDQDTSGQMAETLMIDQLAELKTLSGGIGITEQGLDFLGVAPGAKAGGDTPCLSHEIALTDRDKTHVTAMLDSVKSALARKHPGKGKDGYEGIETLVIDIKTIEVQLLSPRPKTAIVREVFLSILQNLDPQAYSEITGRLKSFIKA